MLHIMIVPFETPPSFSLAIMSAALEQSECCGKVNLPISIASRFKIKGADATCVEGYVGFEYFWGWSGMRWDGMSFSVEG